MLHIVFFLSFLFSRTALFTSGNMYGIDKMDYFITAHILLATAQNVLQLPISATAAH